MTADRARALLGQFSGAIVADGGPPFVVTVPAESWRAFAEFVRDTVGCRFFSFLTAVDWKDAGLEIVAQVDDTAAHVPVLFKTKLGAGVTECASLVPVYRGADWMERECFDMFGVRFTGHPDLRRILLPDDWNGHPLLKSYDVDTPHPPYR
jgi:NADH-quinone oxidoreductase subunit C